MEKWTLGTVLLLWCIGAARPKAAPVSECGVCRTLVPRGTINTFTVIVLVGFLVRRAIRSRDSRHEAEGEGRVRLEGDDEALRGQQLQSGGATDTPGPGHHEVHSNEIWA
jgi:hypothetical protein